MTIRNLRTPLVLIAGMAALLFAGCSPAQPAASNIERADPDRAAEETETQRVAQAALGMEAVVLAHGDLARNGLEQILVVNRPVNAQRGGSGPASPAAVLITRATIIQKNDGKWSEVLRCDERLKNPNGYLGGSPGARVSGWQLVFDPDTKQGLEMKFTPADADRPASGSDESPSKAVVVRWNTRVKRYQSLDQSHERYLNEIPSLETPQSTLR